MHYAISHLWFFFFAWIVDLETCRKYKLREKEEESELEAEYADMMTSLEALNDVIDAQRQDIDMLRSVICEYRRENERLLDRLERIERE